MVLSLKSERLKRYKDIVALLVKYGRSDLVNQADLTSAERLSRKQTSTADEKAHELAADLEALGPTFIKLGQLLSTRGDLLPEPYLEALARLQDQIEPFPYEEVERIVSSELGGRISKLFIDFNTEPAAAASDQLDRHAPMMPVSSGVSGAVGRAIEIAGVRGGTCWAGAPCWGCMPMPA